MKRSVKTILLTAFVLLSFSCDKLVKGEVSYTLIFSPELSNMTEKRLIKDSLVIKSYGMDSLSMIEYPGERITTYINRNNSFWETRNTLIPELSEHYRLDTIITFSKKDTSFLYKSGITFIPTVLDYSIADCRYITKKIGDEYLLIKQSTANKAFKEMFFYDADYKINKYILVWKDNRYVYENRR